MAQKIQESIPDQIYANIALHSDSENIGTDNNTEFPTTPSELKTTTKKSNSLQRFFWRKKTDSDDGPVEIDNKADPTGTDHEKKFLSAKRMHLHLGRHIPGKRSDSLPKREHGEIDLLKQTTSVTKTNNDNNNNNINNRGSGLRAYFSTYWNYIFSRNKQNTNINEIYDNSSSLKNPTDETENKLKSVLATNEDTQNKPAE